MGRLTSATKSLSDTTERALLALTKTESASDFTVHSIARLIRSAERIAVGSERVVFLSTLSDYVVKYSPDCTRQNFSEVRCWAMRDKIKDLRLAPVCAHTKDYRFVVMQKCQVGAVPPFPYTLLDMGQAGQDKDGNYLGYDYGTLLSMLDSSIYRSVFGFSG